jgi:hypothetical protein
MARAANNAWLSFTAQSYKDWEDQVLEFTQKSTLNVFRPCKPKEHKKHSRESTRKKFFIE